MQWAVKTWQVWAEQRDTEEDTQEKCVMLSDNIQVMNEESLSLWVPCFILEVRNKNGNSYSPNSLYQMVCGLQRMVQEDRLHIKLFDSPGLSEIA